MDATTKKELESHLFFAVFSPSKNWSHHLCQVAAPLDSTMDPEQCACCLEDITPETGKTTMGCGHSFHFMCLASWFNVQMRDAAHQTCPCCRREGSHFEALPTILEDVPYEYTLEPLTAEDREEMRIYFREELAWRRSQQPPSPGELPSPPPIQRLRITTWHRTDTLTWSRQVLNPEDDEPHTWSSHEDTPPPASLAIQTNEAAKKIQAAWRGHQQRVTISIARAFINVLAGI